MKSGLSTIYRGRVGAKMRPFTVRKPSRAYRRVRITALGGPLHGKPLRLGEGQGLNTLPIRVRDQVGAYMGGHWVAA